MKLRRLIPIRPYCALRRHRQRKYAAWQDGVQVIVYTCRCGQKQSAGIFPANRKLRRAARKVR